MMISDKMAEALNTQVNKEYESAWIYKQIAFQFQEMGFKVFAQWFAAQATEERSHAEKIAFYILDQGGKVTLTGMSAPSGDLSSAESMCALALEHEKKVTAWINDLVKLARSEDDYATESFLSWFVDEQVEEVATATELLDLVKMASSPGQMLVLESRIMSLRGEGGGGGH